MNLKKEIEKDNFTVEQKLIHYSIGEGLNIYNLRATASKRGGNHSELVRDVYGICFDDELHDIYWFADFETKARHIHIMKKAFRYIREGNNSIVFISDKRVIEALEKQGI